MKGYHVHIYEILAKYEVNVEAENDADARSSAIKVLVDRARAGVALPQVELDNKYIAFSFGD